MARLQAVLPGKSALCSFSINLGESGETSSGSFGPPVVILEHGWAWAAGVGPPSCLARFVWASVSRSRQKFRGRAHIAYGPTNTLFYEEMREARDGLTPS